MGVRKIILWPSMVLSTKSVELTREEIASPETKALANDLIDTMRATGGAGLAAIQIGVPKRMLVIARGEENLVFINPTLTLNGAAEKMVEGCLSVPGVFEAVNRNPTVTVRATNENGHDFTVDADGLTAHALQHELEHLDGQIFVAKLPRKKQLAIREYMVNFKKKAR